MTFFGKIDHLCASTESYLLRVRESYTYALPRNIKYLTIDGQICLHRQLYADAVEPLALRGINRIALGTKLFLMAVLAHPVDCMSSCQILKAQHCCLSPNGCVNSPTAPYLLPPPSYPSIVHPTPYRLNL